MAATVLIALAVIHNLNARFLMPTIRRSRFAYLLYRVLAFFFVPLHELSHAAGCLIFNHRIKKIKLFTFSTSSPTLGYVNHSWNARSVYQSVGCIFIAIAPLITSAILVYFLSESHIQGGTAAIYRLGLPDSILEHTILAWAICKDMAISVIDNGSWNEMLLASLICFYCIPSKTDFINAAKGAVILLPIVIMFILIKYLLEFELNLDKLSYLIVNMIVVIFMSQLIWILLAIIALLTKGQRYE